MHQCQNRYKKEINTIESYQYRWMYIRINSSHYEIYRWLRFIKFQFFKLYYVRLHVVVINNVKTGNFVIISNNAKIYYVSLCNLIGAVFWHGNRYINMFIRYCFLLNWFKCDELFTCITCTIIIKLRNTYSLGRGWCLTHTRRKASCLCLLSTVQYFI